MFFKKMNDKVHMCVWTTSDILQQSVSHFDLGARANLIRRLFIPLKWCDGIQLIHNMSLRSASKSTVQAIATIELFVQLGYLQGTSPVAWWTGLPCRYSSEHHSLTDLSRKNSQRNDASSRSGLVQSQSFRIHGSIKPGGCVSDRV